jgi:hypothetical protein
MGPFNPASLFRAVAGRSRSNTRNLVAGTRTVKTALTEDRAVPKSWNEMSTEEKLDWLRAYLLNLTDTVNGNAGAANHAFNDITRRLKEAEEAVQNISAGQEA